MLSPRYPSSKTCVEENPIRSFSFWARARVDSRQVRTRQKKTGKMAETRGRGMNRREVIGGPFMSESLRGESVVQDPGPNLEQRQCRKYEGSSGKRLPLRLHPAACSCG